MVLEGYKISKVVCGFFYSIVWVIIDMLVFIIYEFVLFFIFRDVLGVILLGKGYFIFNKYYYFIYFGFIKGLLLENYYV